MFVAGQKVVRLVTQPGREYASIHTIGRELPDKGAVQLASDAAAERDVLYDKNSGFEIDAQGKQRRSMILQRLVALA